MTNILTVMIATVKSPAILLSKVKITLIKEFNDKNDIFLDLDFHVSMEIRGSWPNSSKPPNQDSLMPQFRNLDN